jgi:hypothetical protein
MFFSTVSRLQYLSMISAGRVYQGNDMPLHVPLLCNQKHCPKEVLFPPTHDSTIPTLPDIINEETVLLCTFNANKKLEPISFRGSFPPHLHLIIRSLALIGQ